MLSTSPVPPTSGGITTPISAPPSPAALGGGQQWVAKRDRHMQLINTAVYDQTTSARTKAIEATRQEKLRKRSERQKMKLNLFLHTSRGGSHNIGSAGLVNVGGISYRISPNGNKLAKVSGEIFKIPGTQNQDGLSIYLSACQVMRILQPQPLGEQSLGG